MIRIGLRLSVRLSSSILSCLLCLSCLSSFVLCFFTSVSGRGGGGGAVSVKTSPNVPDRLGEAEVFE
jgi:hypothetical protein